MSYEGHEEHLCKMGHKWNIPEPYDWSERDDFCPICQSPSVWMNAVDDTNCNSYGIIPDFEWEKLRLTPTTYKECETCHHKEVLVHETFRQPSRKELERIQYYVDNNGDLAPIHLIGVKRK